MFCPVRYAVAKLRSLSNLTQFDLGQCFNPKLDLTISFTYPQGEGMLMYTPIILRAWMESYFVTPQ
ncbi:hypothetical protein Bamy01_19240 [Bacillus amyloliquefaciens]|nr:hypothetical protein Bamy01_19240 [Bacillus amyloliquefaciens]